MFKILITAIVTISFILQFLRGKKYDDYLINLSFAEYPLNSIYGVGFMWSEMKVFRMPINLKEKIITQLKLIEEPKYAEYYASLTWAQIISFLHFFLMIGLMSTLIVDTNLFLIIFCGFAIASSYYFYNSIGKKVKEREMNCNIELPEVVSTISLLLESGMVLKEAWEIVSYSKSGEIYDLMQLSCDNMKNGMPEKDAINYFGVVSNSPEIKKFASSLVQGIEKGNKELAKILGNQSKEMWEMKRQFMLQKGEAAASKLLIPVTLIFVGVILMVAAGAVGMLMT